MANTATAPPSQATEYLSSFLNKTLHLHTSDGRIFVGQMKCTDTERNIILAMTHEYRQPTEGDLKRAFERYGSDSTAAKVNLSMKKRFVGLVVVPGKYIEKIEAEG